MFYYITGNEDKILMAEEKLRSYEIAFKTKSLPLIEIQSQSIEEIAKNKAEQAYAIIREPIAVSDHGWSIPGLQGFPGPFMKYMNEWLTPHDFLNLTKDLTDRTIILTDIICYKDSKQLQTFTAHSTGTLLKEVRGENPPCMTITTFDGKKTVAEYFAEGVHPIGLKSAWDDFAKFYQKEFSS